MPIPSLTWNQVITWRLSQHALDPRLSRHNFVEAVNRTGGIQAQVMSAAEQALWARTDGLTQAEVQAALWETRTLVKTWAMRATLHLLSADELPLYAAARNAHAGRNWVNYFEFFGITAAQAEAFLDAVPQVLGSEPLTRQQLATAVGEHLGAPDLAQKLLGSSWGSLWKPSAWRGDLCFGPNQGRNVTFVRPAAWLGQWTELEPFPALQEIARRYIRTYGPTTPKRFGLWWGAGITQGRKVFQSIETELQAVEVEGWQAFVLRQSLEAIQTIPANLTTPETVRLLPLFDTYVMDLNRDVEAFLPQQYRRLVYRPQGWISAVLLVGGAVRGVWEIKSSRKKATIKVRPFRTLASSSRTGVEAEAERLAVFLGTEIELIWEKTPPGG